MNNISAMRKAVYILIIIMLFSIVAATVLFFADGGMNNLLDGFGNYDGKSSDGADAVKDGKVDEEKQESISGVENINIKDISENIQFITVDDGDTVKAHFYGEYSSTNKNYKPTLVVNKSGNTLDIKVEYPRGIIAINYRADFKLDIYLPKAYSENLKVSTTSADTAIEGLKLKSFKYSTISGELKAVSVDSGKTELQVTSGDSAISGSLGDFSFKAISGKLTSENFMATSSGMESTSGDVTITGNPGDVTFKSVSGKIDLDYTEKISGGITANTTSGDVNLKLPSDSEFDLDFSATSGDAKCEFPITINGSQDDNKLNGKVGDSNNIIKVNSVSGNLTISKK